MFGKGKKQSISGSFQVTPNGKRMAEMQYKDNPELLILSALLTMQQGTVQEIAINTHMSQGDAKRALSGLRSKGFVVSTGGE